MTQDSLHFFWGDWSHGKDLRRKWIIDDSNLILIEKWCQYSRQDIKYAAVAVPLSMTRRKLDELMTISWVQIASFAWLMGVTMPEYEEGRIATLHALWWPGSEKNLRLVHASDGWDNSLSQSLISRMKERWISVLSRSRAEHDRQMAYHQALTHAVILVHDLLHSDDRKIRPQTNPETIASMINLNPYFLEIWNELIRLLWIWKTLWGAYEQCMQEADRDLFTPNSEKQLLTNAKTWNTWVDLGQFENLNRAIQDQNSSWLETIITKSR